MTWTPPALRGVLGGVLIAVLVRAGAVEAAPADTLGLIPYVGKFMAVEATVAGRTLPFLFDTGGGITMVAPALAESAGCAAVGRMTGYRMSGERIDTPICFDLPISFSRLSLTEPEVAVFDVMTLLPAGLPELGGVLSLRSFAGRTLTVDMAGRRLTVAARPPSEAALAAEGFVPLIVRKATGVSGDELCLYMKADSPSGPLWFLIDSGNMGGVLVSPHVAEMLGLSVAPADAAGGAARTVTLDPAGPAPPDTVVATVTPMIHDGAVGHEYIASRVWMLDLATGRAWVRPASADGR